MAVRFGVADKIQPVPRPTLSVVRGCEQPLDDILESLRRVVGEKVPDLLGRRRKADQVKRDSPQEGAFAGRRSRRQSFGFERSQDEVVHLVERPAASVDRWRQGVSNRLERPEPAALLDVDRNGRSRWGRLVGTRVRGAHANPRREILNLLRTKSSGGRHLQIGITIGDRLDQQARFRRPRNHRRTPAATHRESRPGIEPQAPPSPASWSYGRRSNALSEPVGSSFRRTRCPGSWFGRSRLPCSSRRATTR